MSHKAVNSVTQLRGCLDGVVVNTSALESRGRGFKSRSGQFSEFHLCLFMSLFDWFQFNLRVFIVSKRCLHLPVTCCELGKFVWGAP